MSIKHALNPAAWAADCLGFTPDPVQASVLQTRDKRGILNCSRQWGKSTVIAIKALHFAWFRPDCLVIVISPSARQSGEFLRKVKRFVLKLDVPVHGDGENRISLLLPNQSRIVGLPANEDTIRGFSGAELLVIDEASRVSDDMYSAVTPMLATTDGHLWLMSTPNGKRGFFYRQWNEPEGWIRIIAPATECSRISSRFLAKERKEKGLMKFRQEYLCEFIQPAGALFDELQVRKSLNPAVPAFLGKAA